jgi:hypothetical protein
MTTWMCLFVAEPRTPLVPLRRGFSVDRRERYDLGE